MMDDSAFYDAGYNDGINGRDVSEDFGDNDYYQNGYETGMADYNKRFEA